MNDDVYALLPEAADEPGIKAQLFIQCFLGLGVCFYQQVDISPPGRIVYTRAEHPHRRTDPEESLHFFFNNPNLLFG